MRHVVVGLALVAACTPAMHEPPPVSALAPGRGNGRSAGQLEHEADAAWERRAETGEAAAAQGLYLDAAAADAHRVEGLIGAMRAMSYRIESEPNVAKADLARHEVEVGQWCRRRAPSNAECDYRLAIALGQQAREAPSTGMSAIGTMVDLLHVAIAGAPGLENGGPHRVLALVLLRAPSWPAGPGDSEQGLVEARAAVKLFPQEASNLLVLGEALVANGSREAARAAFRDALARASAARDAGDPDGASLVAQAREGLAKTGG